MYSYILSEILNLSLFPNPFLAFPFVKWDKSNLNRITVTKWDNNIVVVTERINLT